MAPAKTSAYTALRGSTYQMRVAGCPTEQYHRNQRLPSYRGLIIRNAARLDSENRRGTVNHAHVTEGEHHQAEFWQLQVGLKGFLSQGLVIHNDRVLVFVEINFPNC